MILSSDLNYFPDITSVVITSPVITIQATINELWSWFAFTTCVVGSLATPDPGKHLFYKCNLKYFVLKISPCASSLYRLLILRYTCLIVSEHTGVVAC